ncbi:glucose-1-phosphate adenylyltransferase subunit GlgD [Paenibacillus marinisediminis]
MKMLGIVFSNIYDEALGELTKHRTNASLPFGGRYRQIDFVLSNMVNSNISSIGVITKYNYQSLMDHLHLASEWDLNRKNGGLFILPPFGAGKRNVYKGKLEALHGAVSFINKINCDYVLISDSNVLCNINYQPVLESHLKSGADITVIANHEVPELSNQKKDLVLKVEHGEVTEALINYTYTSDMYCGMGMYVMEKSFLLQIIEDSVARGYYHFEKEFLQRRFSENKLKMNVYEFTDTVLRNESTYSYYKNSLKLLDESVREEIFNSERPIYTKVRDEVPTHYLDSTKVIDCLIADGCRIDGTVENSVIFRDVTFEQESVVRNSIVMQGTHIGKGAHIEYAIIDKNVHISDGVTLIGVESSPVIIKKGERI